MVSDPRKLDGALLAERYRVKRKLGAGGMGAVWLVEHVESLQHYALKTLHPRGEIERITLERFLREARAAAALRSKHVVRVIDAQMSHIHAATGEQMPFIVMELLEGENLEHMLQKRGPLTPAQVVWVLRQVARALDIAHQKGIVHRDLKPENLFIALDEDGEAVTKVCDFGIAKLNGAIAQGLMTTGQVGTEGGVLLGTPLYMSPEQARSSSDVVAESDQWAIGLIAYKALTGLEYFGQQISTSELFIKIFIDPFAIPTQLSPSLPAGFDAWFLRSCNRDPKLRWASVGEQIVALASALGVVDGEAPRVVPSIPKQALLETGSAVAKATATLDISVVEDLTLEPSPATITRSPTATTNEPKRETTTTSPTTASRSHRTPILVTLAVVAVLGAVGIGVAVRGKSEPKVTASAEPKTTTAMTTPKDEPKAAATSEKASKVEAGPGEIAASATAEASTNVPATKPPSVSATGTGTTGTTGVGAKKPVGKLPAGPAMTGAVTSPPLPKSGKLQKGAPCTRSAECSSGYCVAEECQ